jgi:hypothetical protein
MPADAWEGPPHLNKREVHARTLPRTRRRLGSADVQAIHAEHAATIAPMAARLTEAARHERTLSDLVLDAYGMSAEECALMWRTAPPRMPIPPPSA